MTTTTQGQSTTYFVNNYYEVTDGVVTKYYYAGNQRLAMRKDGVLTYILGDHLGSTSLVTDAAGNVISDTKYKAWGEERYTSGTKQTDYGYTGQFSHASDFGLLFYNARWLDPSLSRFTSADSIIPQGQGVQAWDRYAYTNNSPVNYTDPSGHCATGLIADTVICADIVIIAVIFTMATEATIYYINETPQGQAYRDEAVRALEHTSKRVLNRIENFDKQVADVNNGNIYPKIKCGIFCKLIVAGVSGLYFCVDIWEEQCTQALSKPAVTTPIVEPTSTPIPTPSSNCLPPYAQCSKDSSIPATTPTPPENPTPQSTPERPIYFPDNRRVIPI